MDVKKKALGPAVICYSRVIRNKLGVEMERIYVKYEKRAKFDIPLSERQVREFIIFLSFADLVPSLVSELRE